MVETSQNKSAHRTKLVLRDLVLTHVISLPIASPDGSESLTCLFMAVPKVGSDHYDTLFWFDRQGIPLAADVRHLHEKVDSDEHLMVSCSLPGNDRRCRRQNAITGAWESSFSAPLIWLTHQGVL